MHLNRPPCASAYHWGAAAFEFHAAYPGSVTSCAGVPDRPCTAMGSVHYSSTCEAGSSPAATVVASAMVVFAAAVAGQLA